MTARPVPLLLASLLACAAGGSAAPPPPDPLLYGGDRPVRLQRPATLLEGQRYPLVLILHGHGSSGAAHQVYFQLLSLPELRNAFVLAPDGTVDAGGLRFWSFTPALGSTVDDVGYLGGLLDQVIADWPIDTARVVVIGHSAGAFMGYRLACDRADVVTAIAGLAGGDVSANVGCVPSRPVSVLHAHGDADAIVAYGGGSFGPGLEYPGAVASARAWAAFDGCGDASTAGPPVDFVYDLPGAETAVHGAAGCPPATGVELWTIQGGSHAPILQVGTGLRLVDWLLSHPRP